MLRDWLWLAGVVGGTGWLLYRGAVKGGGCGGCVHSGGCAARGGCPPAGGPGSA